jgi:predicted ATPase/DNA-binding winged helix-turn-helix (wHTH) protein
MEACREETQCLALRGFRIFPRQGRMLDGEEPVELGARAFELLLALIEAPGAVVSKQALIGRAWPNRIVSENNLQVQISALRNALGADGDLIRTVSGRGYRFTGQVQPLSQALATPPDSAASRRAPPTNLPQTLSELIGRDAELEEVLRLAATHRLVTLTGSGGVGKTRVACEVARRMLPQFRDGVWVAELSPLSEPALVPAAVAAAAAIGLPGGAASAERVAAMLAGRDLLIVLDTCEHVIGAAAETVEALLHAGSGIRVIATSREPLKADGEWVYRLRPLPVPADDAGEPRDHHAVSLFVARARATAGEVAGDCASAAAVAAICRRLDGIPLAIELAAARAATLGIYTLAARLDDQLQLLTCGRRTALPRHQTLRAMLDWSYALLTHPERTVLRRLAVFDGAFGLAAVAAAAADDAMTPSEATDALANLIAKSLVAVDGDGGSVRYRLLETTRAYALEKLTESTAAPRVTQHPPERSDPSVRPLFPPILCGRPPDRAARALS